MFQVSGLYRDTVYIGTYWTRSLANHTELKAPFRILVNYTECLAPGHVRTTTLSHRHDDLLLTSVYLSGELLTMEWSAVARLSEGVARYTLRSCHSASKRCLLCSNYARLPHSYAYGPKQQIGYSVELCRYYRTGQ